MSYILGAQAFLERFRKQLKEPEFRWETEVFRLVGGKLLTEISHYVSPNDVSDVGVRSLTNFEHSRYSSYGWTYKVSREVLAEGKFQVLQVAKIDLELDFGIRLEVKSPFIQRPFLILRKPPGGHQLGKRYQLGKRFWLRKKPKLGPLGAILSSTIRKNLEAGIILDHYTEEHELWKDSWTFPKTLWQRLELSDE